MSDLLSQLEAAPEGSREISDQVLLACGWMRRAEIDPGLSADYGEDVECWYWTDPNGQPYVTQRPDPSQVLQDAVSLWRDGYIKMERYSDGWYVEVAEHSKARKRFRGVQKPDALALCIAIIKAHESKPVKLPQIRRIAEADDGALEGDL